MQQKCSSTSHLCCHHCILLVVLIVQLANNPDEDINGIDWVSISLESLQISACLLVGALAWASYQIRKLVGCAFVANAGNVFPRHRIQRKRLVSDPGVHHGKYVVTWCMSGSLTRGGGENVPGIPCACATRNVAYLARGPLLTPMSTLLTTSLSPAHRLMSTPAKVSRTENSSDKLSVSPAVCENEASARGTDTWWSPPIR